MSDKVVFDHTIEGLFIRGLGSRLSPRARQRLKEAGVDVDKRLLPAYPFNTWMTSLRIAAEELHPGEPLDQAMRKVGEAFIHGYRETLLGRAVLGVMSVLGPQRTLKRATQNFRSGNNYTEATVSDVSPGCADLWMNEVGPYPTFTAGIISAALTAAGSTPTVEVRGHDGHACTFRVTWASS